MNEFTARTPITTKMIADQMSNGFEGGITYWATKARPVVPCEECVSYADGDPWFAQPSLYAGDFRIRIVQHEEHEKGAGTDVYMTPESVQRGLDVMAKDHPTFLSDMITGDGDANTADVFIQCSVFGKLIYG